MYNYNCRCCGSSFIRKKNLQLNKQFCGVKCKYSIEGLLLDYPEAEALQIREDWIESKRRTLSSYIKRFGENEGSIKYFEYIAKHKRSLSLEGYIEKYGVEAGKEKWEAYCISVSNSLEGYIEKYGVEAGKEKWEAYCKNMVRDVNSYKCKLEVSEKAYIERHGVELGKEKWKITSLKKKKSIARNFISKTQGDIMYELYIMVFKEHNLTKIGISINTKDRFKYFCNIFKGGTYYILERDVYNIIRDKEKYLHNKYDEYNADISPNINGFTEFFYLPENEINKLKGKVC